MNEIDTIAEVQPIMLAREQPAFVMTPQIEDILKRAFLYLDVGYPINLSGPAGTGKTTLAMYLAAQAGQPTILIHGDEQFGTSDLVGSEFGYRKRKLVDNFIHSVLKAEEDVSGKWVDNRLTVACKHGFTLIYDEFTRSRAEANNVLLSVLEEKMLDLPAARGTEGYLKVHPDFRAIFTSNPHEYAGVHRAQDALWDRLITIKLGHYDRDTEIAITAAKTGISPPEAGMVVDLVRGLRNHDNNGAIPTVRAAIMIGKVMNMADLSPTSSDEGFTKICLDILDSEMDSLDVSRRSDFRGKITRLIDEICYN
ncbi:MAG: gas vesicle protein GvpN [Candidatus Euphemobacter frigidus]|nr:gas vesicle protein GvpN [Candidatus Euphemobacter frigidus]MDP8274799.1 gas vesicle protein GvpN [Candidatus Euphemobacter frigidus]